MPSGAASGTGTCDMMCATLCSARSICLSGTDAWPLMPCCPPTAAAYRGPVHRRVVEHAERDPVERAVDARACAVALHGGAVRVQTQGVQLWRQLRLGAGVWGDKRGRRANTITTTPQPPPNIHTKPHAAAPRCSAPLLPLLPLPMLASRPARRPAQPSHTRTHSPRRCRPNLSNLRLQRGPAAWRHG
jgi:hypothetical protein